MSISIIITESQKKLLIKESLSSDLSNSIKRSTNFVKRVVEDAKEQIGVNLEFLISMGAMIGGFVGPINDYVQHKNVGISDVELSLILTGVIATYYIDNKKLVKKIYDKIVEEGLSEVFEQTLKKSDELRDTFVEFLLSLNLTLQKVTNMLSYSFVIPILPTIYELVSQGQISEKDAIEVSRRLAYFTGIAIGGIAMKELLTKIIRRFSSR